MKDVRPTYGGRDFFGDLRRLWGGLVMTLGYFFMRFALRASYLEHEPPLTCWFIRLLEKLFQLLNATTEAEGYDGVAGADGGVTIDELAVTIAHQATKRDA